MSGQSACKEARPKQHIVFMNMAATGHMNPTLPLVSELCSRGCHVSYFVEDSMREVVEAAGATWHPFQYPDSDFTGILRNPSDFATLSPSTLAGLGIPEGASLKEYGFPISLIYNAQLVLPSLLDSLRSLEAAPAAIVYEPFLACARVAAHVLGVPAISLFTMPGPGVLSGASDAMAQAEMKPWVQRPRRWIQEEYGLDLLATGGLMEFYSPVENLVTTIDSLFMPATSQRQVRLFGHFPFRCVGVMADEKVRIENAGRGSDRPKWGSDYSKASPSDGVLEQLREARASGKRVLFISLGTVATGRMWTLPLGHGAGQNDAGRPEGARGLSEYTGKELCQHVYRSCFEALGSDCDIFALLATGLCDDALDGLLPVPSNFLVVPSVPQLEVLKLCDAFVTHGGANSMHEALSFGVPMAVVPIFGDQPFNADSVARCGAGVSYRNPLRTLNSSSLRSAVQSLLQPETGHGPIGSNPYRSAVSKQLADAGGAPAAAKAVLDAVRDHQETGKAIHLATTKAAGA
ncbi:unnamed protein product [Polarella glacialis]|uniref:Uncharacterized protein n=1 Tax=Polarella glacialis TaxID=89957 RepID=A0A813D7M1_POLGL|nr:unnamed protein product [Polarella glacialis]